MKKITIESSKFLSALRVVSPAVSKNLIVPILGYVKVSPVDEKSLKVEARNGHLSIVKIWDQDNNLKDSILLPYKEITQILSLVKGDVSIEMSKKIVITAGADVFKLDVPVDVHLFPQSEIFEPVIDVDVEESFFWALGLAKRVLPSKEELRPIRGVNVLFKSNKLSVVGTDAFTMFRQSFKTSVDQLASFIVGRDYISVVERFSDGNLKLGEKFISVQYGSVTVTGVLEDGKYPVVDHILVGCDEQNLMVVKSELQSIVNKAMLFTPKEGFAPLNLNINKKLLDAKLEGVSGSLSSSIECDSDLELDILINQLALNELLSMIQPDQKNLTMQATEARVSIFDKESDQTMLFQTFKSK